MTNHRRGGAGFHGHIYYLEDISSPDQVAGRGRHMTSASFEYVIFVIFAGAAVLATLALYARQALIVGYIVLGAVLGPWGLAVVDNAHAVRDISNIGIIFLLYLLGLDLFPQQLLRMLAEALRITMASSALFWVLGFAVALVFGFHGIDAAMIGAAMMFSSTIIGVKLMPTTALHHRQTGQMVVSILLLQDLLAIVVLLVLRGYGGVNDHLMGMVRQAGALVALTGVAWMLQRYVLVKLITRFDRIHEYVFLLAIAWCLGLSELSAGLGLTPEIGAFVAGITLASNPIAMFITERLKPLRDFFLVLFFFSLGAMFNPHTSGAILIPAVVLALTAVVAKPLVFRTLFVWAGERKPYSLEVGVRLGQISEFSLLIAVLAVRSGFISETTSSLIQLATLLTFVVSSYAVILRYPTPIAVTERLRRD